MKKILLAVLLLAPALCRAQSPKPADYPIAVHVQSSQLATVCHDAFADTDCGFSQHLAVVIDGKKYILNSKDFRNAMLNLGDYKAKKLVARERFPIPTADYETSYATLTYEFLLPDGKTRKYSVVGESE